MQLTDLVFCIR